MIVGIDRMSNSAASICSASVSIFAKVMSVCFSEARSKTGANERHGGHQVAQKSIRVIPSLPTVSAKFSAVTATVPI